MPDSVRYLIALLGITVILVCDAVRSETPEVGAAAPPIELEGLLQAPDGASVDWESLSGKFVLLEFWATWCGPCVAAIPHLNELASEFRDEPLRIIAITDEDRETVESFLEKRPIDAWIGIGLSSATMEAYGVHAIPRTVIVSDVGKVLGVTHPNTLNREHVAALLRGEKVNFPSGRGGIRPGELPSMPASDTPHFRMMIQESTDVANQGSSASNSRGLTMIGTQLERMIRYSLDVTPAEVDIQAELPETLYDVVINRPKNNDKSDHALLKQAIENAFGLEFEPVEREITVDILRRIPGVEPTLSRSDLGSLTVQGTQSGYRFTTADMKNVALNIAGTLGHPVIDESDIDYTFDAELTFDPTDPGTVRKAVRESMGLQLVPERQIRAVWIVRAPDE